MLPGFVDRGPQIDVETLAAFERRCGFPLPPDYGEFLLVQNGGEWALAAEKAPAGVEIPPKHVFLSLGIAEAAGFGLDEVLALHEARMAHELPELMRDLDIGMNWWRFLEYPPEILPIAKVNYGQNQLLLRLNGPEVGKISFLYDPDGYCEWHCELVAASFGELLRGFHRWKHL